MENIKQRVFYIFLALHAILWSVLQLLRNTMSIDAMEAIQWGQLLSFGTNKHPPLSGWLIAGFYNLFGRYEILPYILGQLCLLVGFIFTYKLAKFFMEKEKAFCTVMILEFCFYYTYGIFIDNYNCNILLMGLIPVVTYYFYKSVQQNKLHDWILFGITSGLAFLGKYQIVFLFIGMFLYMLLAKREQFRKKEMYLAILTGSLIILPHVIWLFKNDFFSFAYMIERTDAGIGNTPVLLLKLRHLTCPLKFILDQILAVLPCILVYLILALQAKNISFDKSIIKKEQSIFLLCAGVAPILIHSMMGLITGNRVPGIWGSIMVGFVGILLFYFFPIKFDKNSFMYFTKWCYFGLFASLATVGIFGIFQTKPFIAYPYKTVMEDMNNIWAKETNNAPMKYAAGNLLNCFHFNIHNPNKVEIILESFGHKNPWIDHEDVIKSGAIILAKDEEDLIKRTKEAIYLLPDDYEIVPKTYNLSVCNKLDKCKEKEIFYTIIHPQNY